jgi:site-specific recombinase XerD
MTRRTVHHVVAQAGKAAGIDFPAHPHMLRHATGFFLANAGQDTRAIQLYLGHKSIQHTCAIPNWRPTGSKISGRTDRRI